jgi:tRNA pseudouridine55 synthase
VTSHDVVAQVRRERGRDVKVGHAGTLDPFATGLLLILLGGATRGQRFLMALPKTYRAVARLGWVSDTGDRDGELRHSGRLPERLEIPVGEQMQRPPAYSAVKVGGERLYKRARRGETAEAPARPVTVHRAECLWHSGDRAEFEIECSSGTYVRSLIADLGDAYCDELRRTAIGSFRVEDAGSVVPLEEALAFLPERSLSADEAGVARHGVAVEAGGAEPAGAVRLVHEGRLLGIARAEEGRLKPYLVFPE